MNKLPIQRNRSERGFTIVEILVAVGILAIVAIAVATIFRSIGNTVTAGRRVSELNQLAALIETTLRDDIESMARDGVLVIRHELADAGGDVSLVPDDPAPRKRRVDQLMFLRRGDFETTRPPVFPGMATRSSEARVYYGHGQRRVPKYDDPNDPYLLPDLRDDGVSIFAKNFDARGARLGFDPLPGAENPNWHASEWTLLRHVTLLAEPEPTDAKSLPNFGLAGLYGKPIDRNLFLDRDYVRDTPYQIDLQPAVSTLFWNAQGWNEGLAFGDFGYIDSLDFNGGLLVNSVLDGYGSVFAQIKGARFSSGLIDVASASIEETMSVVSSAAFDPFDVSGTNTVGPILSRASYEQQLEAPASIGGEVLSYPHTPCSPAQQRWWMINALPTAPAELLLPPPFGDPTVLGSGASQRTSPRMRYENLPPDLATGMLMDGSLPSNLDRLRRAYRDADQETLTRSVFLPRCTEFIVEWSYGWIYSDADAASPYFAPAGDPRHGQTVWFGRDRFLDHDENGVQSPGGDEPFVAQFYQRRTPTDAGLTVNADTTMSDVNRAIGPQAAALVGEVFTDATAQPGLGAGTDLIDTNLKDRASGYAGPWPTDADIETAVFGSFWLNTSTSPATVHEWPWPKMLRITIKIAGTGDASDEMTYQSIFEVPGR